MDELVRRQCHEQIFELMVSDNRYLERLKQEPATKVATTEALVNFFQKTPRNIATTKGGVRVE